MGKQESILTGLISLSLNKPALKNIKKEVILMHHKEFNIAPLSGAFMITSIVGFLISAFYILPNSRTWGFTFVLFFTLMFVASLISMTYAPSDWPLRMDKK